MIKPSQHSRLIPLVLGLVLGFSMMSCTKQKIRKINHLFENGKWDKALKKSDKLFEKNMTTKNGVAKYNSSINKLCITHSFKTQVFQDCMHFCTIIPPHNIGLKCANCYTKSC